jgi:hypothetical protein
VPVVQQTLCLRGKDLKMGRSEAGDSDKSSASLRAKKMELLGLL